MKKFLIFEKIGDLTGWPMRKNQKKISYPGKKAEIGKIIAWIYLRVLYLSFSEERKRGWL
jgi:hypothetical protein